MNYLEQMEQELRDLIREGGWEEMDAMPVIAFFKSKIVESFKNGKQAGQRRGTKPGGFDKKKRHASD